MNGTDDGGKPAQTGLVDMGNIAFFDQNGATLPTFTPSDLNNFAGSFSEMVLNVTWAQLQPTEGAVDTSAIDDAIQQLQAFNTSHGTDVGIKLRVWGGFTAPDWAKIIDGPAITITGQNSVDPNVYDPQTMGRVWTADYIDAWTNLQNSLAALYDSNPLIRGISQTAGAVTSDEPFVPLSITAPTSDAPNAPTINQPAELQAGGYNDAAEALTLRAAIADYAAWSTTPLDYTMNNHYVFDSGVEHDDPNFTLAILQQARNSTRMVQPGNHRLQDPIYVADNFLYNQMTADAALTSTASPASYQTASPDGLYKLASSGPYANFSGAYANWPGTVANGVVANTGNVELWNYSGPSIAGTTTINGFLNLSPEQAQFLAALLAAGNPPTTGAPADGSALGFVAPAFMTGAAGTISFSGTDAILLASAASQTSYSVTLQSLNGQTLGVTDVYGIVSGSTGGKASGSTLTFSGSLPEINTVLASLTEALQSGADVVQISASDSGGETATRNVGVQISSTGTSPTPSPAPGPGAFQSHSILAFGGVQSSLALSGNLQVGPGGDATTLLAALSPSAYSTASLIIGDTFEILSGGAAHFTGSLGSPTVKVDSGGVLSGDGTLAASGGGPIVNNGTIEAVADHSLGLMRLNVAGALSGTGTLLIDPGATLILSGEVGSSQTVQFRPNSSVQFANNPYSPSTLTLAAPTTMQGSISGFTFADWLVLDGVTASGASASYAGGVLTVNQQVGGPLSFNLVGDLTGLTPAINAFVSVAGQSIISFVAPTAAGVLPSAAAPATLEGAVGMSVLVPDIVLNTPVPSPTPPDTSIQVTLAATAGTLSAGDNNNFTTVTGNNTDTLTLSGETLATIERSLQTLTYKAAAAGNTTITITVTDYAGTSATPAVIEVSNSAAPLHFDWASAAEGVFGDPANWNLSGGSASKAPGGADVASFGAGTYTVSGDGAVGEILVTGTTTLTGQVTAQGAGGVAALVDGGAFILAGGAAVTAQQEAIVGDTGQGLLVLMGGALALPGTSTPNALVLGAQDGSSGTVVNLEQITAAGTVVVGGAGTGTLELRDVASSVSDGGADIGQSAGGQGSTTVNGGEWTNSGQLIVGDAGTGSLLINGMYGGITGQVTAWSATIGSQAGSHGSVTLDGGEMLVVNDQVASSTLSVGAGGTGILTIENGSEVAIGAALGKPTNNSTTTFTNTGVLLVGGTAGGNGQVTIGDNSELLVYGTASVGGAGVGQVIVGETADETALFALMDTLTVNASGQITLGGAHATVRAPTIDVAPGGVISGAGTLSGDRGGNETTILANINNDGTIQASDGNLLLYGDVTGTGTLSVASGATLTLQGFAASGQTLVFSPNAKVVITDPSALHGTISGFLSGDTIDFTTIGYKSSLEAIWHADVNGGTLQVVDTANSSTVANLSFAGSFSGEVFTLGSDGASGFNIGAFNVPGVNSPPGSYTLSAIENIVGGPGDETLVGSDMPNVLSGGAGNDTLDSNAGLERDWAGQAFRLYETALGRGPDVGGFDYWIGQFRDGMNLGTAAGGFTGSPEFQSTYGSMDDTQFVTLLYNNALHRAPDPGGLAYWLNQLTTGMSRSDVVLGFSESAEEKGDQQAGLQDFIHFQDQAQSNVLDGGSGTDTASYTAAQGGVTVSLAVSGPQETFGAGIDTLSNIENLTGSSSDDRLTGDANPNVLSGGPGNDILDSSGGLEHDWAGQAYRLYETTLNRDPDPGGFDYWVSQLRSGMTLDDAANGFTGSPEFQNTYGSLDDTQFVTLLYGNALHRAPDPGGLSYWLNLLNTGTSRSDVVLGFSNSPEQQGDQQAGVQDFIHFVDPAQGNILDGGDGSDTASYALAQGGVTVSLAVSGPQETFGAGVDTLVNIENLTGSTHADTLSGDINPNTLTGGGGGDTMKGHAGEALNPTDPNTYVYNATTDSTPGPGNFDTITDFTPGVDKIDLSAIAGLTAVASASSAPGTIAPNTIEIVALGGNAIIYANATGAPEATGNADMEIHLTGVTGLTNMTSADLLHA